MPKKRPKPITTLATSSEVAELFGRDVRTVHRWTAEGRLTAVAKLPGKTGAWLYDRADIERIAADTIVVRTVVARPKASA